MSDEKQETIADIVKDLRRQSDSESAFATELRRTDDDVDFASAACYAEDAKYLARIADRIEAAWKREKAEIEANALAFGGVVEAARHTPGNAAALREALELALDALISWLNGTIDRTTNRETIKAIRAALSAPARNCDRFDGDIDKLREACARERGLNPEEDFPEVFCEWLLSKAKGENNANK